MKLTLKVWRQKNKDSKGKFETYQAEANEHMSFLEMLDVVNETLIKNNHDPIAFDHDCRKGICGACVAACPNASAMLFVAAKVSHLANFPQGQIEAKTRVQNMVKKMDAEGFGNCTNHGECQEACPKEISIKFISKMNREYLIALP